MNAGRTNYRRFALLLVIILLLAVAIMLAARDYIREVVIQPLSYTFWLGSLVVKSAPQAFFWGLLLLFLCLFAIRSLRAAKLGVQETNEGEIKTPRRGRVSFWLIQVSHGRGDYLRWHFSKFFGRLILEVLTFREQLNPAQMERSLENGQIEIPPEVQQYLRLRRMPGLGWKRNWLVKLKERLQTLKNPADRDRFFTQATFFEQDLESAVQFLEKQLEVNHDDRDR